MDWSQLFKEDGVSYTDGEVTRFCNLLSFVCSTNAKRYQGGGYGGPNPFFHVLSSVGNTDISTLTFPQQSLRNDVKIWMEASTCGSADVLITDDRRFFDIFKDDIQELFKVTFQQSFGIEPIKLVSAEEYMFSNM